MKLLLNHTLGILAISAVLALPAYGQGDNEPSDLPLPGASTPAQPPAAASAAPVAPSVVVNPPAPVRTIAVSGEASQQVMPDQAILSMSLISKDKNLNVAKQHNDALVDRLTNIARGFDIPKEKIATSNIYIAPEYSYDNDENKQVFNGYTVNRSIRITMDSLDVHEKLLTAITEAQIDQVNGIEFRLSDPEKAAAGLRVKALENAKAKAAALATAAGAKLGQVMSISTNSMSTPIVAPMAQAPMPMLATAAGGAATPPQSVPTSLPGTVELRESVSATFALE